MRARIVFALAASLGLAACQSDGPTPTGAPLSAAAGQEDLLTLLPAPALNNAQKALLSTIRGRPSTSEVNVGRLASVAARLLHQGGGAVRLSLAPGRQVVAQGAQVEERGQNDISWSGPLQGEEGTLQLVLSNEGMTGNIRTETTLFHIEPLGGGLHAVSRVDMSKLPPEHTPDNPSGVLDYAGPALDASPFEGSPYTTALAAASTQNVLVVYTAAALTASGNITNLIQLAVDETNRSYTNSGVGITMTRVHTAQVTYSEAGRSFSQHTTALRSSTDGIMDVVHTLRNTYAADIVLLVVNDSEACGQAAAIKATSTTAFAVAHYSCITGYYSFGHEIGHLQGARHDRAVDGSTSPYTYGHGYVDPNDRWRTIMAYGNACNNCTRVQYWSTPLKTYPSTGQVMGTATYEDNARVLNTTAATVAAFR
ncbi:MAG TPA: M12 family metallo-peptidase [Longimicrobiaceae bacterium]